MNPRRIRTLLIVLGISVVLFSTAVMVLASIWPTINRVETGKTIEYPDILPRTYQMGYDRVYDEVLAAAQEQQSWEILSESRQEGRIHAQATMPITGWTQDVRIHVDKRSEFVARVHVLSEGHDAPGDLGQNARNIRDYFVALDARLGASAVN